MASIPHFYSDYPFLNDPSQFSYPLLGVENCGGAVHSGTTSNGAVWADESYPITLDINGALDTFPSESDLMMPAPATSFPARLGISNLAVSALPEYSMGLCGLSVGNQNYGGGFQFGDHVYEFGEECCGLAPEIKPACHAAAESWGIQGNHTPAAEDSNIKVGRYSVEERKDRILRYLKKRNQRNFNKTIKYACRKTLADRRVRIRGRFARNSECEEEMMSSKKNDNDQHKQDELYSADAVQIKHDEEEWLQEAMSNLMYLPYIAG